MIDAFVGTYTRSLARANYRDSKIMGDILYLSNNLKKLLMMEKHSGFNLKTKHSPTARHKLKHTGTSCKVVDTNFVLLNLGKRK
jgi:hypothetical protein